MAGGAWATALVATWLPAVSGAVAVPLWALSLCVLTGLAMRHSHRHPRSTSRWAAVLVLGLVASAGAASHVALAQPARTAAERFALDGGRAVALEATVVGKVERRAGGVWAFDAVATRVVTGSVGEQVRFDIVVRVPPSGVDRADLLDVGAVVQVRGTARAGPPGDRAVLQVTASRGSTVLLGPSGASAVAADLRRGLVAATEGLPPPGAGLIPGLAVGDTTAVSSELDAAMKESSLSHLTAVSGANCAIVVGLAFAVVAALGGSRRARVCAGVTALVGFTVLVTPEPSVVRAGTMAAIAMLGVLLGRTGAGTSVLSLAVAMLLIADPWLSGSLGFALSAVATASLLLFARPLADGLARRMPRSLALALSVPLAAQLACGPLLVIVAPTVPIYGVVANLLAAPAAPLATIVGLAACLTAPMPLVQSGLTAVAWLPAAWIAGTAQTFGSLPGNQVPWLEGWPGVATLSAVGLAVGTVIVVPRGASLYRSPGSRASRPAGLIRAGAVVLLALVGGIVAGGTALASVAGRWTLPAQWSVLACDVGQGDAVLVRSAGAIALIDTGPDPEKLDACLTRAGVDHVDLLVLTHFDQDHVGGAEALTGRVGSVLSGPVATPEAAAVLTRLGNEDTRMIDGREGLSGTLGDARWRLVWPPPQSRAFPSGNDASLVIELEGGGLPTSLFLGDLSASPQAAIAASGALDPPYELVKVAHHGSADQFAGLYELADPAVALVTVGGENTYGHPRTEILALLGDLGTAVARTDRAGMVAVWTEGGQLRVWRERGSDVPPAG